MRVTFVTCGLEHLGIEALSAWVRQAGHEPALVYEARPFSSGSGTDSALLARLLDPRPEETAERVVATRPDVVAFTSYSVTHRWSVDVARAVKQRCAVPIVFGGPHVSAAPERAIREWSIDAVVEGEGEGALVDLIECAERGRFGRTDVANCTFKGDGGPVRNRVRPLLAGSRRAAVGGQARLLRRGAGLRARVLRGLAARLSVPLQLLRVQHLPKQYPGEKPVRRRSVEHLIAELAFWKARGRVRKVFFWDAIFTLDANWMAEFAPAYRREIGIPVRVLHAPADDDARHGALARRGRLHDGARRRAERELRHAGRRRPQGRPGEGGADAALPGRVRRALLGRSHHRPARRGRRRPTRRAALLRRGAAEAHRHALDDVLPGHHRARPRARARHSRRRGHRAHPRRRRRPRLHVRRQQGVPRPRRAPAPVGRVRSAAAAAARGDRVAARASGAIATCAASA